MRAGINLKNASKKDLIDIIIIVIVVILIRTFIMTPALVNGASMDDTLKDGQLVILNKIAITQITSNSFFHILANIYFPLSQHQIHN